MDFDDMGVLVRFLKGAESSILWALLLGKRPMTAVSLQEATGYSDKPVREALRRMEAVGLVRHYGRNAGWGASGEDWAGILEQLQEGEREEADEHNLSTSTEQEGTAVGESVIESGESSVESGESPIGGMGSAPAAERGLGSADFGVRSNSGFVGDSAVERGESAGGGRRGSGVGVRNRCGFGGKSAIESGESAAALARGRGLDLTTAAYYYYYSSDKRSKQKRRACAREGVPEKRGPPGGDCGWGVSLVVDGRRQHMTFDTVILVDFPVTLRLSSQLL